MDDIAKEYKINIWSKILKNNWIKIKKRGQYWILIYIWKYFLNLEEKENMENLKKMFKNQVNNIIKKKTQN